MIHMHFNVIIYVSQGFLKCSHSTQMPVVLQIGYKRFLSDPCWCIRHYTKSAYWYLYKITQKIGRVLMLSFISFTWIFSKGILNIVNSLSPTSTFPAYDGLTILTVNCNLFMFWIFSPLFTQYCKLYNYKKRKWKENRYKFTNIL
jgi:hypothetical protein